MRTSDIALLLAAVGIVVLILLRRWGRASTKKPPATNLQPLPSRPVSIPPEQIDTAGAIEDMRLAQSYFEDWGKTPGNDHVLGLAAKYIEAARAKDPSAKLFYRDKEGEEHYRTQDSMASLALYYQARSEMAGFNDPETLRKIRDILLKAISYSPSSILYREHLADVYLDLHDRPAALAVAKEAIKVDATDLDARKLLDKIESAPETSPPGYLERNPYIIALLGTLLLTAGVIALVASIFGNYGGLAAILLVSGTVFFFMGRAAEHREIQNLAEAEMKRRKHAE